ncbi:MAG: glycosyltransferase family 2 protein [Candidatus Peribacteraceae bacterium]|nr:glycosyltransferase family 2 protein [Candidatus Peribacteraceae bacterium]MDD5742738.1 glycosyltransferase family 2 protein [Candidatus Peribacteraceae bacterium]
MEKRPLVSAIIVTTWSAQDAVKCVQALLQQTIASDLEILVIDNHSEDDSIGTLRVRFGHHPRVRLLESNRNRGYGAGNNYAAQFARGEYLLIINPDNELEPEGLERMVQTLRQDPSIGILAPKLEYPDGRVRESARAFPTLLDVLIKRTFLQYLFPGRLRHYLQTDAPDLPLRDTDWVVGACLFFRKDFFDQLGGFDQRFFLFFEDMDLCRRCLGAGKRVVFASSIVARDRKQRLSGGGFFSLLLKRTGRIHIASAVKYFWKWKSEA